MSTPCWPGQDETANLLLDHATEPPLVFRVRGPMAEPVEVSSSAHTVGVHPGSRMMQWQAVRARALRAGRAGDVES